MRNVALTIVILFALITELSGQQATRWRGPDANGIYPDRGLLSSWPDGGPTMLWKFERMDKGYSSPAFSDGHIYIASMLDKTGYLYKLDMNGKQIWRVEYGPEFYESYPGARGTATIAGDHLYYLSGRGKLVCLNTDDGSLRWTRHLVSDLNGVMNRYGFNETVVVDGDKLYCTPGGNSQSVAALNRFTGETIWVAEGKGDKPAYCTPLMIDLPDRKLLVTHTESYILGIDRSNGRLLWAHHWPNQRLEHQNTPLYYKGNIFCFSGYGKGAVMLSLSEDGASVKEKWQNQKFDNRMGGAVLIDGYIYGCGHNSRSWQCLDWESGKLMYESRELALGVVIFADGLLYCSDEKGVLALVRPDPSGFNIVSRTLINDGTGPLWAHPVIHKGILYLSRGNALMAYDIRQK